MNERLEQLRLEASRYAKEQYPNDIVEWAMCMSEKFAELIVAECIEVFSKDLPEEGDGKMLEVINRVCAVAEHFGVEE
jgi:hypothetical protein